MRTGSSGDGYRLRVATAEDVPLIGSLYNGLSERSVRSRFFSSGMSTEALLDAAAISDETIAVVALRGPDIAAEARYLPSDGVHELAIAVADEHQGHGLGTRLLDYLREVARLRGVTTLRAVIQSDNTPMTSVVHRLGCAALTPQDGDVVVDIASDGYMPDWGPDTGRPRLLLESSRPLDSRDAAALHRAGYDVRSCLGPRSDGPGCPLLTYGRCRLAEQADLIAGLLPAGTGPWDRIVDQHLRTRPDQLIATSVSQWRGFVSELAGADASGSCA